MRRWSSIRRTDTTYTLPTDYQAEFLGGGASRDPTLSDPSGGDALLVGNTGTDTLMSGAANDTILGGSFSTTNIQFLSTATHGVAFSGSGSDITLTDAGGMDTIAMLGASSANVTTSGSDALVFGGVGSLSAALGGASPTLIGGSGPVTVTIGASASDPVTSGAVVFGGTGSLALTDQGSNDSIAVFGAASVTATLDGTDALVFGGTGDFVASVGGSGSTLIGGSGAISATIAGGEFGGVGVRWVEHLVDRRSGRIRHRRRVRRIPGERDDRRGG